MVRFTGRNDNLEDVPFDSNQKRIDREVLTTKYCDDNPQLNVPVGPKHTRLKKTRPEKTPA